MSVSLVAVVALCLLSAVAASPPSDPIFELYWDGNTPKATGYTINTNSNPVKIAGPNAFYPDGFQTNSHWDFWYTSPNIPIGTEWTIDVWFRTPLPTHGNWNTLCRGSNDHQVIVHPSTRELGMFDNAGGTSFHGSGFYPNSELSAGWHHMLAIASGSGVGQTAFYIDGEHVGTANRRSTTDIYAIGNYQGGGQWWGDFAGFKVYDYAVSPYTYYQACTNGTVNDPTVALPPPVLQTPVIQNNNYELRIDADSRFNRVQILFDEDNANTCNYDLLASSNGEWTRTPATSDPICAVTYTHIISAQSMLASCAFAPPVTNGNYQVYYNTIAVITNQTRYIAHAQNTRNQTYYQISTNHFTIQISVPTTFNIELATTNVTGNITVLQAVSGLNVNTPLSGPYTVDFTLIASSQAPYQLTYNSFTSSADMGNTLTPPSSNPPACSIGPESSCLQSFAFTGIDIVTTCPTKSFLNDDFTVTFDVGCQSSFAGACVTPEPSQITVSFTLNSQDYCPQVENVTLSATMDLYKDVQLADVPAWDTSQRTTQFVIGSTVYGLIEVSVGQDAASTASTVLSSLKSEGTGGAIKELVTSGSPVSGSGVTLHNGDATVHFGGAGNDNYKKQTRFAVPLVHDQTVALNAVTDEQQAVKFLATVTVTFTTAGADDQTHLMGSWSKAHSGTSSRQDIHLSASRRGAAVQATISVGSSAVNSPSQASSSAASTGTITVTVAVALAVLALAAAYRAGYRSGHADADSDPSETGSKILGELAKSSSTVELPVEPSCDDQA